MEQRGIVTERGDINREIVAKNGLLWQLMAKIKQLKDWLKEAVTPAVQREEKPSIMAQLNQYKKEIKEAKETIQAEPPALVELRARFNTALENLKRVDRRMKSANGIDEFDKIMVERRKAYNENSALKSEVKKAEASLPQRKPRSWDLEQ